MCENCSKPHANELNACNFSKTVLMILVVLCHAIDFWTGVWFTRNPVFESKLLGLLAEYIGSFHIYGFALISGYIYRFLKIEKNRYSELCPFIKNKAMRLLVPYVFACVVWVAPVMCLFFKHNPMQCVKNFVFAISPGQLWFLWTLFFVFAISYILTKAFEKNIMTGAVISLMLYGGGILAGSVLPNVIQIWTACQYVCKRQDQHT